jgi:flagellar basal body P-ring protein FlgI
MKRRQVLQLLSGAALLGMSGCSWFNGLTMRSQSPEPAEPEEPRTRLVSDLAVPFGMHPVRVQAVGLVTGLHGAGSDPGPSPQRAALLEEMQTRGVTNPNTVLSSGDVSLVLLQGVLRPGIQKGDHFDIDLRVPSQSETTSLRGGFLLETRLQEMAVLGNQLHPGKLLALARGPVMVDPTADPKKDRILLCRGRILGGGLALKSRPLGLVLTPGHQNVMNSSRVANVVNKRFHTFQKGIKTGVAKAKTDEFIELVVHPRYKDNIARYVQVVRAVAIAESAHERMQRVASLQSKLLDPATAADAAVQLEAIGSEGVDVLCKGINAKDAEVRFYAAEALAYLDRREAAEPLGLIARDQPAFRVFAMTALSAMQDFAAYEQLRGLLSAPSAETRYGAFRALWAMNEKDPLVKGERLGGQFGYHVLDVSGPPMVHVTRNRVAELVLFGTEQRLTTPLAVNAGNDIMVTSSGGDEIAVSKYTVADGDQKRTVSTRLDDVIRAVVELGGTYPDVVQALQEAKNSGALASRFEVDALPEAGRSYDRIATGEEGEGEEGERVQTAAASPSPELSTKRGAGSSNADGDSAEKTGENAATDDDSDAKAHTKKGFFAKILGR